VNPLPVTVLRPAPDTFVSNYYRITSLLIISAFTEINPAAFQSFLPSNFRHLQHTCENKGRNGEDMDHYA
jgi:hypothetical protein